jgi:hypothetical protein
MPQRRAEHVQQSRPEARHSKNLVQRAEVGISIFTALSLQGQETGCSSRLVPGWPSRTS